MVSREIKEKKMSRNGRRSDAGLALQASSFRRPACRRSFLNLRGSQVVEYALVFAAISAALSVMYIYGKRGMQNVIRTTVDREIGSQIDSEPVAGFMADEFSQSLSGTVAGDSSRVQENSGGVVYDVNSFTSTTGVATSVSTGG